MLQDAAPLHLNQPKDQAHGFAPTEEQNAIFEMAFEFGQEHIAPFALE